LLSLQSVAWRGGYALAAPLIGYTLDHHGTGGAVVVAALIGTVPLLLALALGRFEPGK
jgi:predicted MFS family arabinose efflux permease